MRTPLLVACLLLLAGCSAAPADPADLPAEATADGTPTAAATAPMPNGTAAPQRRPVMTSQSLGPCVAVHGAPDDAATLPCRLVPGGRVVRFQQDGTLVGANLTVQWTPASPTMDTLQVRLAPVSDCGIAGDLCFEATPVQAEGPSPLVLAAEGLAWTHGDYAVILEWTGDVEASPEQPFTLSGDVAIVP